MSLSSSPARFLLRNYVIGYSLAFTILIADVIVLTYVIVHSDWGHARAASIEALGAFASLMAVVPIGLFTSLHRQQRAVSLAASVVNHDITHAPISMLQAGNEGIVEAGEILHVSRLCQIRLPATINSFAFIAIIFGIFIDALLIKSHAVISFTSHSPLASITLAFPFLLGAMLLLPALLSRSWQRRLAIRADDVGITIQQSGQSDVSLPWGDIAYVVYSPARRVWPYPLVHFDGYYVIGNAQRFITFNTWYSNALALQSNPFVRLQFEPNDDAFMVGLVRILATIQTKQAIEMRVPERLLMQTRRLAQIRDREVADDDNSDEPLLPAVIQPRADLVSQMEQTQETIVLRPRLKLAQIARKATICTIVAFIFFVPFWGGEALLNGMFHDNDQYYPLFHTRSEAIMLSLCLVAVILLFSMWFGWADARKERITVIADEHGLTVYKGRGKKKHCVAWNTIITWIMSPHGEDSTHRTTYFVHGSYFLVWYESASDTLASSRRGKNETFQQRAEKLHALIAAKTHLPLLNIPYEPVTKTWWQRLLA